MEMQGLLRLVAALSVLLLSPPWIVPTFAAKIGPEFQVNSVTTARQTRPRVATFSDGSFVVVWTSENQDPNNSRGVYARRYRSDGTRTGPEFRVNQTIANSQDSAEIAALSNGGFVVVWTSSGQDGSLNGVYGQRFRADGTPAGPEFKVNTRTINIQQAPAVRRWPAETLSSPGSHGARTVRGSVSMASATAAPVRALGTSSV